MKENQKIKVKEEEFEGTIRELVNKFPVFNVNEMNLLTKTAHKKGFLNGIVIGAVASIIGIAIADLCYLWFFK